MTICTWPLTTWPLTAYRIGRRERVVGREGSAGTCHHSGAQMKGEEGRDGLGEIFAINLRTTSLNLSYPGRIPTRHTFRHCRIISTTVRTIRYTPITTITMAGVDRAELDSVGLGVGWNDRISDLSDTSKNAVCNLSVHNGNVIIVSYNIFLNIILKGSVHERPICMHFVAIFQVAQNPLKFAMQKRMPSEMNK